MIVGIPCEVIVANLFAAGLKEITGNDFSDARDRIESTMGGVYVQINWDARVWAAQFFFPHVRMDDETIVLEDEDYFTIELVDEQFNWKIPEEAIAAIRDI